MNRALTQVKKQLKHETYFTPKIFRCPLDNNFRGYIKFQTLKDKRDVISFAPFKTLPSASLIKFLTESLIYKRESSQVSPMKMFLRLILGRVYIEIVTCACPQAVTNNCLLYLCLQ